MPFDLTSHPHFEKHTDAVTGMDSFILSERVAPVQQSFYFTNPGISADGKWMWFYCAHPPAEYRHMAVVSLDPEKPLIRAFPAATFTSASPMVAPEGDAVYFCARNHVYRQEIDGEPSIVCTVDSDWIAMRSFGRIATHLTMSADRRYFLLDGDIGAHWWVGLGDVETGEVKVLKEFARHHNHAQFSPVDPKLFMIPQDWWHDKLTGKYFPIDHRIWLMDTEQTMFEPLSQSEWFGRNAWPSHEWWSADGKVCWTDYHKGAFECDPTDRRAIHVWRRPLCHTHCDRTRRYWVADQSPYQWDKRPCEVLFFDRETGGEIAIASLPAPCVPRGMYHLDPHPQFSPDGELVCYTTTVRGGIDIAIAETDSCVKEAGDGPVMP